MTPVGRGDVIPTMGAMVDRLHPNGALHWRQNLSHGFTGLWKHTPEKQTPLFVLSIHCVWVPIECSYKLGQ